MSDEIRKILVQEGGNRLDKFLAKSEEDLSRSFIQKLIKTERVTINGKPAKASYKVQEGELIFLDIPPAKPMRVYPQKIPLNIIFYDNDLVVLNKQPGLVVHPAVGHPDGTLVNALLFHLEGFCFAEGDLRPGIVHRLDRDTSGVMVVAKNEKTKKDLIDLFKNREEPAESKIVS